MLPTNIDNTTLESELNKIIPSIDDILDIYRNKNLSMMELYNILNKFNYDKCLPIEILKKLHSKHKKLYKLKDFSSFNDSGATVQYKYWALGTSGSLFRSTNNLIFDEVNLNLHPSCSLNSLFFLPDSTISNDPNVNYFSTPNISYRSSFKRGYIFVVGDSGSIFYSSDYGNTFNQAYFPRTDINLHDVYYFKDYHKFNPSLGNETTDYLMVVGTSGSIYVTSGSSKSTQYSGGSVSYDSIDSVNLFNNWINGYSYSTLWNYVGSTSTAFPSQQKRENLTITRILPYYSINASTNNAGTADNTLFLFFYLLLVRYVGCLLQITLAASQRVLEEGRLL
jgi:hypothetical protein